ncbi:hypothetical protein [Amycolatopsis sp. NPDC059657]|uniref:hypothetical protein n=1 Tax=Amycolatopsis sp. NPDC059657 TaxID=3346899 RepID=UPI0036732B11
MSDEREGFEADLTELENGIKNDIEPALEHFQQLYEDVETIADHDVAKLLGTGGPVLMGMFAASAAAVLDGQRAAVASLEGFRDALNDVVRSYRAVEDATGGNVKAAGVIR